MARLTKRKKWYAIQNRLEFFKIRKWIISSAGNYQAHSQPVFSGKPEGPFVLSCTFIFRNERNWMKKSARVTEKLVSPALTWLTGSYAPDYYQLLPDYSTECMRGYMNIKNGISYNCSKCRELVLTGIRQHDAELFNARNLNT